MGLILLLTACFGAGSPVLSQKRYETAQDVNDRIRALSAAFQGRGTDYLIGAGDLLKIDVFDVPDLSRELRVNESGYISFPLIPVKVRVAGLTTFQLEEKLGELLQVNGLVRNPQVAVFVKEQRSQPITIIGAVRAPRVLQAVRPMSLLEVLSEAGGIAEDAGSVVIVTRPAPEAPPAAPGAPPAEKPVPQTFTIALKDLLDTGDAQFNIPVFGGDTVAVPRGGIIYVAGAVERPGGFVLTSDSEEMTTLKAIALAQGLKGTAKAGEAVIIRRDAATGKSQEIDVHLGKIMGRKAPDVPLLANDILFVPDSTGKKMLKRMGDIAASVTSGLIIVRAGN
jgi:polysaccharide export outer membrane protein